MKDKKKNSDSGELNKKKSAGENSKRSRASKKSATETPGKGKAPKDAALKERLLRLQADFENFRKRTVREKDDLYQRANDDLLFELLSVLDHLELALNATEESSGNDSFVQGVKLVHEQMLATLAKFGLLPIDANGLDFDPTLHEAISYLASDEVPENKVLAQTRRGYKSGDKVLRAAQVVVSSGPADTEAETNSASEEAVSSDKGAEEVCLSQDKIVE